MFDAIDETELFPAIYQNTCQDEAVMTSYMKEEKLLQRHVSVILKEKNIITRSIDVEKKKLLRRSKSLQATLLGTKDEKYRYKEKIVPELKKLYGESEGFTVVSDDLTVKREEDPLLNYLNVEKFKTDDISADLRQIAKRYAQTKPIAKLGKSDTLERSKSKHEVKEEWERKSDKLLHDQMSVWRDKFKESLMTSAPRRRRASALPKRVRKISETNSLPSLKLQVPNIQRSQSMTPTLTRRGRDEDICGREEDKVRGSIDHRSDSHFQNVQKWRVASVDIGVDGLYIRDVLPSIKISTESI